ncbi:MAG TPA: methyltransferase domain-containing protein [Terriglobales bacterium]|nr:methyltransferase domain-containing protein [Terriglobales bacterium]
MAREWKSAEYHRLSDPQFSWGLKVIKKLEAMRLRGDERILDAGCGTGRVTAALLEALPRARVVAVDASENMVREARVTLAPFAERVTVEHLDLLRLSADQRFEVIFSTAVFHWIKDHDRLFANLHRALRPGGLLLAQCGGGPNLKLIRERADAIIRSPAYAAFFGNWQKVWEYPTPEVTAERLERAGFVDVATGLEAAPARLADVATFREFCATVILEPYLERLPPELQARFLDTITAQAAADDPPLTLDYWRLNLQARRASVGA